MEVLFAVELGSLLAIFLLFIRGQWVRLVNGFLDAFLSAPSRKIPSVFFHKKSQRDVDKIQFDIQVTYHGMANMGLKNIVFLLKV